MLPLGRQDHLSGLLRLWGTGSTGVHICGEHKLLKCRMFSRMVQLIAWRLMGLGAGLPTPPKRATAGLPHRVPLQSQSDPGGVGRPAPSAKMFTALM